jgi:hypothetical protein
LRCGGVLQCHGLAWHSFAEGLPPDLSGAFLVWVLYAGISATCVVGYGLFGTYSRLIRAERLGASNYTSDVR